MATVTDEIKRHNFSGTPTPVKPLEATAHHEAGHAVVSCFLRVRFLFVTILPHKASHSLGRIVYRKSKWFKQGPDDSDRSRRLVEKHIISTLAAQIAETKFLGKRPRYGMQGDNRSAVDLAFSRCGSDRTAEAYLHYCWCVAEDHVNLLWPQISAVAESLLAQKSLTWADVCAVAAKTPASVTKEKSL
jgi:hypothetical protein